MSISQRPARIFIEDQTATGDWIASPPVCLGAAQGRCEVPIRKGRRIVVAEAPASGEQAPDRRSIESGSPSNDYPPPPTDEQWAAAFKA